MSSIAPPSDGVSHLLESERADHRRLPIDSINLILVSAWCGLAAGLVESVARIACRAIDPTERLYILSRHFVWLGPLANLLFFFGMGVCLAVAIKLSPSVFNWLGSRLICACAVMTSLMAIGPHIYPEAWLLVGLGFAIQLVPIVERHAASIRRWVAWSFPFMLLVVLLLASNIYLGDRLKLSREANRPLPPAGSPNVLLIVMDTVRADHLGIYGSGRPTTPSLDGLARRGIRFDGARSTAPWTLPSHASMFTGRWPHELVQKWLTPIKGDFPTLADYLGDRGYATAGFVANVGYCSQETGLARGFTHYEDYVLEKLAPIRTSGLVEYLTGAISEGIPALDIDSLRGFQILMNRWLGIGNRKHAASIKDAFLDWLSQKQDPNRPFFAFLNFFDAHDPYIPPPGAYRRFAHYPLTRDEQRVVYEQWMSLDQMTLPQPYINLARNSYDDCIGYLDEQLGILFNELERRGVLDHTLVIVTSDHGEGFGERNLFGHGESLYRPEIRVPLVIVPPSGLDRSLVVGETVSLRDLPATIVDHLGLGDWSPFPGISLGRFWKNTSASNKGPPRAGNPVVSELTSPNLTQPNRGRSPAARGPLISIADNQFVYIRNEGDGSEELFDERNDPLEYIDRSRFESMRPVLEDFRRQVERFRGKSEPSPK